MTAPEYKQLKAFARVDGALLAVLMITCCLMFFYGGLIFALAQYAYMAYMDKGYLVMTITNILALPENAEVIKQLGMADQVSESIHMLQAMRPIDFALNMLTTIIMGGIMLGLPIAAIMKKVKVEY